MLVISWSWKLMIYFELILKFCLDSELCVVQQFSRFDILCVSLCNFVEPCRQDNGAIFSTTAFSCNSFFLIFCLHLITVANFMIVISLDTHDILFLNYKKLYQHSPVELRNCQNNSAFGSAVDDLQSWRESLAVVCTHCRHLVARVSVCFCV